MNGCNRPLQLSSATIRRIAEHAYGLLICLFTLIPSSHAFQLTNNSGLAASSEDSRELLLERRASLRRLGDAKYFGLDVSYVRGTDILAATALVGCGNEEWKRFIVDLPDKNGKTEPTEIFSLVPLTRYLYQFGSCLSDVQKKQLLVELNKPQHVLGHGTTNMAIVQASSWYLLAQYFPDANWTDIENRRVYTSAQLMAALKPLLAARTHGIFRSGHYEWLSPSYGVTNVFPLLNLIDFAADDEIKTNARDEAILEIAALKADSFHGVIVPPFTRKNFDQHNASDNPKNYNPNGSQQLLWYYFGEPEGLGLYDFRSGLGAFFVSLLGISSWLPPASVLDLNSAGPSAEYQPIKSVTPRFNIWGAHVDPEIFGDSLITEDFSIGTGNVLFDPDEYSGHIQTFSILLKSTKPHNEIECYQPYWHSSAGEDAWLTDRSSPFQQMYRYNDTSVVMLFDIPKVDPWRSNPRNRYWADRSTHANSLLQMVACRFAKDFDEIIEEKKWIFARHGAVFVAMATLKGDNEYDHASDALLQHFKVVKIREPKTALFFRVEKQRADLNFLQFREQVRQNLPVYDSAASSISLTEHNGTKTKVIFELKQTGKVGYWSALPKIVNDGQVIKYDDSYAMQAPGLTLRNGVLTIKTATGEMKLSH